MLDRVLARALDRDAVGHRIAERNADLDGVRRARDRAQHVQELARAWDNRP